jgi:hypothetical protein
MSDTANTSSDGDVLQRIQVRHHLEEINHFILHDDGELMEAPGKLSLVWTDTLWNLRRYLSVKVSGNDQILINGKRYPATESDLKQGLLACINELH